MAEECATQFFFPKEYGLAGLSVIIHPDLYNCLHKHCPNSCASKHILMSTLFAVSQVVLSSENIFLCNALLVCQRLLYFEEGLMWLLSYLLWKYLFCHIKDSYGYWEYNTSQIFDCLIVVITLNNLNPEFTLSSKMIWLMTLDTLQSRINSILSPV